MHKCAISGAFTVNDTDRMAISVNLDQTAPSGAV